MVTCYDVSPVNLHNRYNITYFSLLLLVYSELGFATTWTARLL